MKKARRPDHFFNMVECALALAVVAIGVVSIVALFPVGMEAQRDAIGENFSAQTADMLLHYQAKQAKDNWGTMTALPTVMPEDTVTGFETAFTSSGAMTPSTVLWTQATNGMFKVEVINNKTSQPDFTGIFRLWRSDLQYSYYNGGWLVATLPSNKAQALNMEVSWPSQAPYPARKRALYHLEVFNPN